MTPPTWKIIEKRIEQPEIFGRHSDAATNDILDLLDALHAYEARLTLATALIAALTFGGTLSPNMMTPDQRVAWARWTEEMK